MAVLKVSDNSEMIISCKCGCDDGLRIKIEKDEEDYCFMTYLSGNWYNRFQRNPPRPGLRPGKARPRQQRWGWRRSF